MTFLNLSISQPLQTTELSNFGIYKEDLGLSVMSDEKGWALGTVVFGEMEITGLFFPLVVKSLLFFVLITYNFALFSWISLITLCSLWKQSVQISSNFTKRKKLLFDERKSYLASFKSRFSPFSL